MLNQYVANRVRIVLHRVYLFVHCPTKGLSQLGRDLAHSGHILGTITRVVGENHADEVFPRKKLQVVEDFFDELLLMPVVCFS